VSAPPRVGLVALDLDGTVFGRDLVVSDRVRSAVAATRERGIPVTLVTGRMFVATLPYARLLGIRGPVVCYQGAAIYDADSGALLRETPVAHDDALRIADRARGDGRHVQLYHDDKFYCEQRNRFADLYARLSGVEPIVVPSLAREFDGRASTKCNVITDAADAATYETVVRETGGPSTYVTRSMPEFIEVMNARVDKGKALGVVAQHWGVAMDAVLAIGDSYNDVPLLDAAGFGVAMGSAPDSVKARADAVVGDVAHDGVAEALERFVLAAPAGAGGSTVR
jgi:Cof subfamily protein (haloacid dehalogenase superfamily)